MTTAIADAPPLPLTLAQQKYQGVERTGAGFLLLQRMGWREGEGLVSVLVRNSWRGRRRVGMS